MIGSQQHEHNLGGQRIAVFIFFVVRKNDALDGSR